MTSIRTKLVIRLTLLLTAIMVFILLVTDIAVDEWISDEFEHGMTNKVALLATLISEDEDFNGLEFDFAREFMPEFERRDDPEFYQLWQGDKTFRRSETLNLFSVNNLPFKAIAMDEEVFESITLPDGRLGKIVYKKVMPHVDAGQKEAFAEHLKQHDLVQLPVTIAYALTSEALDFVLWFIDLAFVVAAIIVIVSIRVIVSKVVDNSLLPLDELNRQINQMRLDMPNAQFALQVPVAELAPILDSLNSFFKQNQALLAKEKRLTCDIAHELQTPISELISLAEVSIKFPNSQELNQDFKPEVLSIGNRLKTIVANILMIHKYTHQQLVKSDVFKVDEVLQRLIGQLDRERFVLVCEQELPPIQDNLFAVDCIFGNLFKNAQLYSPANSTIAVDIAYLGDVIEVKVSNEMLVPLSEADRSDMFDPLWQKDASRSSNENFGLGLAIVKVMCQAIGAQVRVKCVDKRIIFVVSVHI